ncbi:MAG: hypothetical protein ACYC1D_12380, partial [Acidimicrobiales bacterium]
MGGDRVLSGPDVAVVAGRFGALLHAAGVPVTPERASGFAAALLVAGPATTTELYWTARVTLLGDVTHLGAFDGVFAQVFAGMSDVAAWRGDPLPPAPAARPQTLQPAPRSDAAAERPDQVRPSVVTPGPDVA